jgi:hypothetical protein
MRAHVPPWSKMSHGFAADSFHSCHEIPARSSWWKRFETFWWHACWDGMSPFANEKSLFASHRMNWPETIAA